MLLALVIGLGLPAGCAEPGGGPGGGRAAPGAGRRIVTLAPSLTRYVVDLGLGDALVGVSEHDSAAPEGVPAVGHVFDLDSEKLVRARPTVVLALTSDGGLPARLEELAGGGAFELASWSYPADIESALEILSPRAPGARPGLGAVLGVPGEAEALRARVEKALGRRAAETGERPPPRVLLAFSTDPFMAAGPGSVLHELLTEYAGARNVAAGASVSAPVYDREKLLEAAPEVIVLLLPGAPPLEVPAGEDPRLAALKDLDIPAVRDGRIVLLNDPEALLPASSMPELLARLVEVIWE